MSLGPVSASISLGVRAGTAHTWQLLAPPPKVDVVVVKPQTGGNIANHPVAMGETAATRYCSEERRVLLVGSSPCSRSAFRSRGQGPWGIHTACKGTAAPGTLHRSPGSVLNRGIAHRHY